MGNIIGTNTQTMGRDISQYGTMVQMVETALGDAYSAINELNNTWTGPAHDALVAQFVSDKEIMDDMLKILRDYGTDLDNAKREYETCENNVDSLIRSMKV